MLKDAPPSYEDSNLSGFSDDNPSSSSSSSYRLIPTSDEHEVDEDDLEQGLLDSSGQIKYHFSGSALVSTDTSCNNVDLLGELQVGVSIPISSEF